MKLIRIIPFILWFYGFLFTIQPIKRNIKKYREEGNREMERAEIRKAEDAWGKALVKKVGVTLNVRVAEPLPKGPVVFVSNHQSYWDIPVFFAAVLDRQFGFVAKDSLRKVPGFGSWITAIRSVFIKREDARASLRAIEEGVELLKQGYSLVIFPEGTRSRGPEMQEFKKGSLRLATKAGVPVVPVTISGTFRAFEEKGYICPATIDFIIHPAIETADLPRKEAADLAERVEAIVRAGLE